MLFSESLKKNRDFQYVYKNGSSCANKYLVMYVMENHQGGNRLGISVSKKVGNSVVRHRITRLIRESYRLHEKVFNSGLDIVVIARISAAAKPSAAGTSGRISPGARSCHAVLHLGKLHKILVSQ